MAADKPTPPTWGQFHFLRKNHSLISPWAYNPFVCAPRLAAIVILSALMPEHRKAGD